MKIEGQGKLLRIFIGELDKHNKQSLFEVIIHKVKELGLAGCTIIRGIEGFGANSRFIHTAKILRLSEDLPIIIEIVDTKDRIEKAMSELDQIIDDANCGVLMTLETVQIVRYRPKESNEQ